MGLVVDLAAGYSRVAVLAEVLRDRYPVFVFGDIAEPREIAVNAGR